MLDQMGLLVGHLAPKPFPGPSSGAFAEPGFRPWLGTVSESPRRRRHGLKELSREEGPWGHHGVRGN